MPDLSTDNYKFSSFGFSWKEGEKPVSAPLKIELGPILGDKELVQRLKLILNSQEQKPRQYLGWSSAKLRFLNKISFAQGFRADVSLGIMTNAAMSPSRVESMNGLFSRTSVVARHRSGAHLRCILDPFEAEGSIITGPYNTHFSEEDFSFGGFRCSERVVKHRPEKELFGLLDEFIQGIRCGDSSVWERLHLVPAFELDQSCLEMILRDGGGLTVEYSQLPDFVRTNEIPSLRAALPVAWPKSPSSYEK